MASFNKTVLIGRLTRDSELKRIPNGTAVCTFAIAVNRYYNDSNGERQEETSFFDVIIWGKRGETFNEYTSKGDEVLIDGHLKQDRWESDGKTHSKIKVICESFQFLTKRERQQEHDNFDDNPGNVPF